MSLAQLLLLPSLESLSSGGPVVDSYLLLEDAGQIGLESGGGFLTLE